MQVLAEKRVGVVAHFYMDPEVQGVLAAAAAHWPHINVSDSLVMADAAVRMAEAGCAAVAVLGVDFMSENVRAILDEAGYQDVKARPCFWKFILHWFSCVVKSGPHCNSCWAWVHVIQDVTYWTRLD